MQIGAHGLPMNATRLHTAIQRLDYSLRTQGLVPHACVRGVRGCAACARGDARGKIWLFLKRFIMSFSSSLAFSEMLSWLSA